MHRSVVRGPVRAVIAAMSLLACGANGIVSVGLDERNRSVAARVGDEVQINLGTVGPGEYASPPEISSSVLNYLGVSVVPPYVPAGVRQQFRFKAVGRGKAIIVFQHTGSGPTVQDTVEVR